MSFQVNCGQSIFHNNVLMKPIPRRCSATTSHERPTGTLPVIGTILSTSVIRKSPGTRAITHQLHTSDCPHPALYFRHWLKTPPPDPMCPSWCLTSGRLVFNITFTSAPPSRLKQPHPHPFLLHYTVFLLQWNCFCQTSVFVYHVFPSQECKLMKIPRGKSIYPQ